MEKKRHDQTCSQRETFKDPLWGPCTGGQGARLGFLNSVQLVHFLHPPEKTGTKQFTLWGGPQIRQKREEEKVGPTQFLAKDESIWGHVILAPLEEFADLVNAGCDVAADLSIRKFALVSGCDAGFDDALFHGGEAWKKKIKSIRTDQKSRNDPIMWAGNQIIN